MSRTPAELDRVDDVDLLAELIVGEERDLDLSGDAAGRDLLDEVVVIDPAIGELGIVGQRGGEFQFQHRRFRSPDQRRRGERERRAKQRAAVHDERHVLFPRCAALWFRPRWLGAKLVLLVWLAQVASFLF
jgi:hypothetical protein